MLCSIILYGIIIYIFVHIYRLVVCFKDLDGPPLMASIIYLQCLQTSSQKQQKPV